MTNEVTGAESPANLRLRAVARLSGPSGSHGGRLDMSAALAVLYKLACSPSSAPDALALLHELQVHQVEVDLQEEELRRTRAELEAALFRQVQLYDSAPAGCSTIDQRTVLREVNLTAAGMLGAERDQLLGRRLDSFLAPESARALKAMLTRLCDGTPMTVGALQLVTGPGALRSLHTCANRDPDGRHFFVVFLDVAEPKK
jgi:PAS domain S-box-containing protein